jgi:hypothetical protein
MAWGGGGSGVLTLDAALAIRENVVRLDFGTTVFFTALLDPSDAANPEKYALAPVAGTVGLDGDPARVVSVVAVSLPGPDELPPNDVGRFVDLVLDRPMSPYPCRYDVAANDIFSADLLQNLASGTARLDAVFKLLAPPVVEVPRPVRDIANPQFIRDAVGADASGLGTFRVGTDGDYAFDEGDASLRKRIVRRLTAVAGRFAHLGPGYGVGIPSYGKKLILAGTLGKIVTEAERQLALEPEVARVRVRAQQDPANPGLVRFRVLVRTRAGDARIYDVPFPTAEAA